MDGVLSRLRTGPGNRDGAFSRMPKYRKRITRPLPRIGVYITIHYSPTEERMRKMTWILGLFVGGLCLAELASGQQGGFGGFGGGFGKAPDPVTLINNASVKKELDITDEQSAAVPAAVMKALGGVLNEKQFKRFKQIHVQQQGAQAFADKSVQGELKLTAAQKENVKTILDDNRKELLELIPKGG